jgi:hypothetical protein
MQAEIAFWLLATLAKPDCRSIRKHGQCCDARSHRKAFIGRQRANSTTTPTRLILFLAQCDASKAIQLVLAVRQSTLLALPNVNQHLQSQRFLRKRDCLTTLGSRRKICRSRSRGRREPVPLGPPSAALIRTQRIPLSPSNFRVPIPMLLANLGCDRQCAVSD